VNLRNYSNTGINACDRKIEIRIPYNFISHCYKNSHPITGIQIVTLITMLWLRDQVMVLPLPLRCKTGHLLSSKDVTGDHVTTEGMCEVGHVKA